MVAHQPGTMIADRYRIEFEVGRGGMGVVYRAVDTRLGSPVALKVLLPQASVDAVAVERLQREARAASRLRHPNAVPVLDFGSEDGLTYLVMPFLQGANLRDLQAELVAQTGRQLSMQQLLTIAGQTADALAAAHALPLIHRDIKPENIFIDRSQPTLRAMVVDFGLAILLEDDTGRLTKTGEIFGSPGYMAPEQASGQVETAADVYSLGCVLYEMVSGAPPFVGGGLQVVTRHLFELPVPLREVQPNVPPRLDALVMSMLAKRGARRPTAAEVRDELAAVGRGERADARVGDAQSGLHRAARMVDTPEQTLEMQRFTKGQPLSTIGEISSQTKYALMSNGFVIEPFERDRSSRDVLVLALGLDPQAVAQLVQAGYPIIAAADPKDVGVLSSFLRAGALDVTSLPLAVDELLETLRGALRKQSRRRGRGGRR